MNDLVNEESVNEVKNLPLLKGPILSKWIFPLSAQTAPEW